MKNAEDRIDVEEIGNNLFLVNGVRIYAPNVATAIIRYKKKKGD